MLGLASTVGAAELATAWEQMLRSHPALKVAESRKAARDAGLTAVRAAQLPRVDASANYQYNSELVRTRMEIPALSPGMQSVDRELTVGDHDRAELGVTATYALFTGFAHRNQIAAQDYALKAAEMDLARTRNQLGFQFGMLHWGIRLAEVEARLRASRLEARRAHVHTLETQQNSGVATSAQLLGARAEFSLAVADTAATHRTLDSLAAEFAALTGTEYPYQDTTALAFVSADTVLRSWSAEALDAQSQSLQKSGDAATSTRYPMVSAFAGYRYGNPGINQGIDEWMGYGIVGVQAQWNLFDGFERKSTRVRFSAEAQALQSEAERQRLQQSVGVSNLRAERQASHAETEALRTALEAAQGALDAYRASLGNGAATADDVLDAELRVIEMRARIDQRRIRDAMLELRMQWISGAPLQLVETTP